MSAPELRVRILDRRTGATLGRGEYRLVLRELHGGTTVSLTGDSEDGRRIVLQISADCLDDIPASDRALSERERMEIAERAHEIHAR